MRSVLCAVLSFFALAAGVRADEIRLKDGSKIVGNVVGFEDGSFKVETAYGFALIRKDSISEIIPAAPAGPKQSAPLPKPLLASQPKRLLLARRPSQRPRRQLIRRRLHQPS